MVRVNTDIETILREEIIDYNRSRGYMAEGFVLCDEEQKLYAWIVVPEKGHPFIKNAKVSVMARLLNEFVVVEEDTTDRPLYLELMRRGIPREQIILRYAGEKLPDSE